jgi:hypothetical protein
MNPELIVPRPAEYYCLLSPLFILLLLFYGDNVLYLNPWYHEEQCLPQPMISRGAIVTGYLNPWYITRSNLTSQPMISRGEQCLPQPMISRGAIVTGYLNPWYHEEQSYLSTHDIMGWGNRCSSWYHHEEQWLHQPMISRGEQCLPQPMISRGAITLTLLN